MFIGSMQQLAETPDSCAKVTQSQSSDCSGSHKGNRLSQLENNRKVRREIANFNERRRMQCINAGFQSLKTLLPLKEDEKLSKAAILQQTAEYILNLERDKTRLLQQNTTLKRLLANCECQNLVDLRLPAKQQKCELKLEPISEVKQGGMSEIHPQYDRDDCSGMLVKEKKLDLGVGNHKQPPIISSRLGKPKSGQNLDSIVSAIRQVEEGKTNGIENSNYSRTKSGEFYHDRYSSKLK